MFNFATTLAKLHVVGYSWSEIIEKVTLVPAEVFKLEGKGQLVAGYDADVTIFDRVESTQTLVDSQGNERQANEWLQPVKAIVGGKQYDINL